MAQHVTFAVAAVSKFLSTNVTLKFMKRNVTNFALLSACVILGFDSSERPHYIFRSLEDGTKTVKLATKQR
jgi:hypothetical protein